MTLINLKNVLRENLFFISLRLYSRGENPKDYIVRRGDTEICIDGYPRSANSFSVRMFRQANPDTIIAHHTHSIGNLKKAIVCGIPSVALIRDPEQAIVSSVIAHKEEDIDSEVSRYISIYSWVEANIDKLVIADFNRCVNDFNAIINDINVKFDQSFSLLQDTANADYQVKKDIEKRYDKLGQSKMSHIKPLPTDQRSKEQEKLSELLLAHSEYKEAKALYEKVMNNILGSRAKT